MSRARDTTVGYLPQEAAGEVRGSVLGEVLSGFPEVWEVERQLEDWPPGSTRPPTRR